MKRFVFFEKELVTQNGNDREKTKQPHAGIQSLDITSCCSGRSRVVFGEANGSISFVDEEFALDSIKAHESFVSQVFQLSTRDILITVGDGIDPRSDHVQDRSARVAAAGVARMRGQELWEVAPYHAPPGNGVSIVKIWAFGMEHDTPLLVRTLEVEITGGGGGYNGFTGRNVAITIASASEDMSRIALGFINGAVIVLQGRGDLSFPGTKLFPPVLLKEPGPAAVTALVFSERRGGRPVPLHSLFVTTDSSCGHGGLWSFFLPPPGQVLASALKGQGSTGASISGDGGGVCTKGLSLDDVGCLPQCAVEGPQGEFIMGQPEAVYFFTPEERGRCYGFAGDKRLLCSFGHYLAVGYEDKAARGAHTLVVYDLSFKFVAFTMALPTSASSGGGGRRALGGHDGPEEVRFVVHEWGQVLVVTSTNSVWRLVEKDAASKLEALLKKNLFSTAIKLASTPGYDVKPETVMEMQRQFGDHLYRKTDYESAITQYKLTIGHVEPSYVIRRFLDAQLILYLSSYLEELHACGLANGDHTTLLLNCYTKLKDVTKLDVFVGLPSPSSSFFATSSLTVPPVASTSATALALEGARFDVDTAITVLRSAGYSRHALFLARKHKRHDWYLKIQLEAAEPEFEDALAYIQSLPFSLAEGFLKSYGKALVSALPEPTTGLLMQLCTATFHPSAHRRGGGELGVDGPHLGVRKDGSSSSSGGLRSRPDDFIHLYADQSKALRRFLDHCWAERRQNITQSAGNTLLELMLRDGSERSEGGANGKISTPKIKGERLGWEDEVMQFLKTEPGRYYNLDQALVLVEMHSFKQGQLFLYEQLHMFHMTLQHYMERRDRTMVMTTARKFSAKDPRIWLKVLAHFAMVTSGMTEEEAAKSGYWEAISEVLLQHVGPADLPTLQVLHTLSVDPVLPLRVTKPYIVKCLEAEREALVSNEEKINSLRSETAAMQREIHDLRTSARVFQATKCSSCGLSLELPVVHFMCNHSFHQGCVPETDHMECGLCADKHRMWEEVARGQEAKAGQHELFFRQLETAVDGFSEVAEYFGKGVFTRVG